MKKTTNILLSCLIALSVWCITACDETIGGTNEGGPVGFPSDTMLVDAVSGDTVSISFNVGYNWRITSDKKWCRVDGDFQSTTGKSGEHSVKFVIGEPDNLFADDEALITLRVNEESRVIARITYRAAKRYTVKVSTEGRVYASGESIVIGASGQLVLDLEPNFNIDQLSSRFPAWVEMTREGTTMTLSVQEDSVKYIINNTNDSLCLLKDSISLSSFHVQYVGMDPRMILIDGQLEAPLSISRDAKQVSVGEETKEMPLAFAVTALNNEYQVLSLRYDKMDGYNILPDKERWFSLTDDGSGNISLSVAETNEGKDRVAILLAFPKMIADSLESLGIEGIVDFLYEEVDRVKTFKETTKQYLLAQMTQYGPTGITINPEAQWGLKVAVDGATYSTSTLSDTLEAPLKATVTTDDGYQLLHINYDYEKGCVIMPESDSWLKVTDDKQGNIEVNFERNTGNMRTAYLLAVPVVIAEDKDNLASELFEVAEGQEDGPLEIRIDAEKYVIAQFKQDAEEESSLKVIDANLGWKYLTVEKETDDKWLTIAAAKGVSPKKVFRTELENGTPYTLNALISKEVWSPGDVERNDRIEVYNKDGDMYTQGKIKSGDDFEAEPYEDKELEGDYMLMQFNTSYNIPLDECYIIYFVTADDVYLKALVVWNYWNEE